MTGQFAAIGGVVLVILALVGFLAWRSRKYGAAKMERDQAQKGIEHARKARKIDERVRRATDDKLNRSLRGDPD